jgi:hypothetical protein
VHPVSEMNILVDPRQFGDITGQAELRAAHTAIALQRRSLPIHRLR